MTLPPNLLLIVPHGSYYIPPQWQERLTSPYIQQRMQRYFSDFATHYLAEGLLPREQLVMAEYSRALGDPNRAPDSDSLFREVDFSGVGVWHQPLTDEDKTTLLDTFYHPFHTELRTKLTTLESEHDHVYVVDLHDTGEVMLMPDPSMNYPRTNFTMPLVNLGTCHGQSCHPVTAQRFADALSHEFQTQTLIDTPFAGGYITQHYGAQWNQSHVPEHRFRREVIQLELHRGLYMDESAQEVNLDRLTVVCDSLRRALAALCSA